MAQRKTRHADTRRADEVMEKASCKSGTGAAQGSGPVYVLLRADAAACCIIGLY
jgi:hypothetical protein